MTFPPPHSSLRSSRPRAACGPWRLSTVKKTFETAAAPGHDLRVQVKGHQPTLRRAGAPRAPSATACEAHTSPVLDRRRHPQRPGQVCAAHDLPAPWAEPIAAVGQVQRVSDAFSTRPGRWRRRRETRYDVGSRFASAAVLAQAIRWGIENRVHYLKDVTLPEDASRLRQNPGLFARLRRFALNLLRAKGETHISLATYDNALHLDRVLQYVGVLQ